MKVKELSKLSAVPSDWNEVLENVINPVLKKHLDEEVSEDLTLCLCDYHNGCNVIGKKGYFMHNKVHNIFNDLPEGHIPDIAISTIFNNVPENSFTFVNWGIPEEYDRGYFTETKRTRLTEYNNTPRQLYVDAVYNLVNDYSSVNNDVVGLEQYIVGLPKAQEPLMLFLKFGTKHIAYMLYDSIHFKSESEKEVFDLLMEACSKTVASDIFKNKKVENGESELAYKTISEKIDEIEVDKDEIISEMMGKINIDRITKIVNAKLFWHGFDSKALTNKEITAWLNNWAEAKWKIYMALGRNISIKTTVKYEKDDRTFKEDIEELCNMYPKYIDVLNNFSTIDYKKNEISYIPEVYERYKSVINISKGMKLSKFLSKFLQDSDFDISISKVLQDKHTERELYISIDPFDYLTSSINKSGWNSCHNFITGEHGNGCVSYMLDKCTLVAYTCNGKEYEYCIGGHKFNGNSKNWRQLIFLSTEGNQCIFSRQYPQSYYNDIIAKATREMIEESISNFCGITNKWIVHKNYSIKDRDYTYPYSFAYNDIPHNETKTITHKSGAGIGSRIEIGAKIICPVCNESHSIYEDDYRLIGCSDCLPNYLFDEDYDEDEDDEEDFAF